MLKTIYLAGGCFWGTAHLFSLVPGVDAAVAGYANSSVANPTYEQVCTGHTGAAETVKIDYDPRQRRPDRIFFNYTSEHRSSLINRQGAGDQGTQYRTGIYYTDPADLPR